MKISNRCVPSYVLRRDDGETELYVHAINGRMSSTHSHVVYKGPLNVKVVSFDYYKIREYKVSTFDGHELKQQ